MNTHVEVLGDDGRWHKMETVQDIKIEVDLDGSRAIITTIGPVLDMEELPATIDERPIEEACKVCNGTGEIPLATGVAPCDCQRR